MALRAGHDMTLGDMFWTKNRGNCLGQNPICLRSLIVFAYNEHVKHREANRPFAESLESRRVGAHLGSWVDPHAMCREEMHIHMLRSLVWTFPCSLLEDMHLRIPKMKYSISSLGG